MVLVMLLFGSAAPARSGDRDFQLCKFVEKTVTEEKLIRQIGFLSDTLCGGRASGTPGNCEAAFWISRQFDDCSLEKISGKRCQSFYAGKGVAGHNVIGFLNGSSTHHSNRYIVIGAHYDNLGFIDGKLFAGADSNASGVVAMTNLAAMMALLRAMGREFRSNLIFVAFDAKSHSMAGSVEFWNYLMDGRLRDPVSGRVVKPSDLDFMVNFDQIGSTLEPVGQRKDYLIMLGNGKLPESLRQKPVISNFRLDSPLELSYDYYGSPKFTDLFYRLSDQRIFIDNKVPAVFFTSGITMKTNKTSDTVDTIDAPVLKKRIAFIFHWLESIL